MGECRLSDGTLAAVATTDWVILDERGRLVRIPDDFGLSFSNPQLDEDILRVDPAPPAGADGSGTRSEGEPELVRIEISVRPRDLDPMGHVNNAVYLDWIEEILGSADCDVSAVPRRYRIEYLASAESGDRVVGLGRRVGETWHLSLAREAGSELVRAAVTVAAGT